MASKNNQPDDHYDPTGVFGRVGATLPLDGTEVQIKILRIGEIKAQKAALDACAYDLSDLDGSPGQAYYDAAVQFGKWEELATWLAFWTEPPVTNEQLEAAYPDEIVRLIDAIFEQSGMGWAKRALGNLRTALRQRMQLGLPAPLLDSLLSTTANASTSTTSSSSESPETPQTPEPQRTPATG